MPSARLTRNSSRRSPSDSGTPRLFNQSCASGEATYRRPKSSEIVIRDGDLEHPAPFVGLGVNRLWTIDQVLVDGYHLQPPAHRCLKPPSRTRPPIFPRLSRLDDRFQEVPHRPHRRVHLVHGRLCLRSLFRRRHPSPTRANARIA